MLFNVFLLVFCVLPASFSPVCKCEGRRINAPKMTPEVVVFKLRVTESGDEYTETIEVDESKQTEVFNVPAHPEVDRSDVMHDFKLNLTMLRFPESQLCYLLPLDKEQPNPQKLIEDQTRVQGMRVTVPGYRKDTKWEPTEELWDRSVLSNELAVFCAKYRIYRVKQVKDSLVLASIEGRGRGEPRVRRNPGVNKLCRGGMNLEQAYENCYSGHRRKCKVVNRTCTKYYYCPGMETFALIPQSTHRLPTPITDDCKKTHIWNGIVCCEYVCK